MTAGLFADLGLARRFERTEGDASRRYVEARGRLDPASGAGWVDVAGTYALFDGTDSPLTQTFGLGMFERASDGQLDQIERFFTDRGATTYHEVSPLAQGVLPLLHRRGYEPFEFSTVLFQPLGRAWSESAVRPPASPIAVRVIATADLDVWNEVAAAGWSDTPELQAFMLAFGRVTASAERMLTFGAVIDGRPVATGSLMIHDGVALLAGASTVPSARGLGAQAALLAARLRTARDHGCDVAMVVALPGSGSQRNAERNGFRVAYTRLKWRRPALAPL